MQVSSLKDIGHQHCDGCWCALAAPAGMVLCVSCGTWMSGTPTNSGRLDRTGGFDMSESCCAGCDQVSLCDGQFIDYPRMDDWVEMAICFMGDLVTETGEIVTCGDPAVDAELQRVHSS